MIRLLTPKSIVTAATRVADSGVSRLESAVSRDVFQSTSEIEESLNKFLILPKKAPNKTNWELELKWYDKIVKAIEKRNKGIRKAQQGLVGKPSIWKSLKCLFVNLKYFKNIESIKPITQEEIDKTIAIQKAIKQEFHVETDRPYDVVSAEQSYNVMNFLHKKGYQLPNKSISTFVFASLKTQFLLHTPFLSRLLSKIHIYPELNLGFTIRHSETVFTHIIKKLNSLNNRKIIHEIGHYLHNNRLSDKEDDYLYRHIFNQKTKKLICKELDIHASINPFEFVATYFEHHMSSAMAGKPAPELSPELHELYRLLKGPEIK